MQTQTQRAATSRLAPLSPPYDPEVAATLTRMMPPGQEPLNLFRTVAHNGHLLDKLRSTGAYLLNYGTLDALDRELVIHRTLRPVRMRVRVGRARRDLRPGRGAHRRPAPGDRPRRRRRPRLEPGAGAADGLADELHDTAACPTRCGARWSQRYSPEQLVELVALAGQYHAVAFFANALDVARGWSARRFPPAPTGSRRR